MATNRAQIEKIFVDLNKQIKRLNAERRKIRSPPISKCEAILLGQVSLLVNEKVSAILSLAQTADLDAKLKMDHSVLIELKKILEREGLVYDDDSPLIFIPRDSKFDTLFEFDCVTIKAIDPESALVSKAVKAPEKNKQLIREAIASDKFAKLVDRIQSNGGNLENFT
jgi:hypothetical protein